LWLQLFARSVGLVVTAICAKQPMIQVGIAMHNGICGAFHLLHTSRVENLRNTAEHWFQKRFLTLFKADGEMLTHASQTLGEAGIAHGDSLTSLALVWW